MFTESMWRMAPELTEASAYPPSWQVIILGFGTVFIGLVCLILIITLMGKIMQAVGKKQSAVTEAVPAVPTQPAVYEPVSVPAGVKAAVAAAIATVMGTDVKGIRILSFKRADAAQKDPALTAALAASIATVMGTDVKGIRIHSIKKIG